MTKVRTSRAAASLLALLCFAWPVAAAEPVEIFVDLEQPGRPVSRYLTGACIEDVNHEIYGGLYSQMIFGESFQEPPRASPVKGFLATEGEWRAENGGVACAGGDGAKLVAQMEPLDAGEVSVFLLLPGNAAGNAGLIVNVNKPAAGADNFYGYEIALDAAAKRLIIGRHQHDFRLLKDAPCEISSNRWTKLSVKVDGKSIQAFVDERPVLQVEDPHPLPPGAVGVRCWQRPAQFRDLWTKTAHAATELAFRAPDATPISISGMWGGIQTGDAKLQATLERAPAFAGQQSQRVTHAGGSGDVGIENQGLNRWGMSFVEKKDYEGYVWARADDPVEVFPTLESGDGSKAYAQTRLTISGNQWRRYDFKLSPDATDPRARFSLRLKKPGSVVIGHAFLQPGAWGRFKNLPVRRDVAQAMVDQGITVLRYGGSMVNEPTYRWKNMIGPRDRRPPYRGHWYPHSTNGWGIIDFLDLCEAAGFLAIPDFNIDETTQDMADFIEYVNGSPDSEWGRRRAADGHPAPYKLRHIELGNEEKVDEVYYRKFAALAQVLWEKDPSLILVVGDFQYEKVITDPMHVEDANSGVSSLIGQKKILDLARRNGREVWFDVHMWTDGPSRSRAANAFTSYVDAMEKLAQGAKHHVVVFEFNANNHQQRRALANADAIGAIIRDGRVPVALSANGLQPSGQNDNGWDQGLLFLDPSRVWLQPPGFVTQMIAKNYQPRTAAVRLTGIDESLTATATCSDDRKHLVLQVVNLAAEPRSARIHFKGFAPEKPLASLDVLAGPLNSANTASDPAHITPRHADWQHDFKDGDATYTFAPTSFTVIRLD